MEMVGGDEMTPQEMITLLNLESDSPPWDGEIQEIHATLMINRRPVRVRILNFYEYCGRQKATVQALNGNPFLETNTWYHTWYSNTRNVQLAFLWDVTLMY